MAEIMAGYLPLRKSGCVSISIEKGIPTQALSCQTTVIATKWLIIFIFVINPFLVNQVK